MRITRNTSFEKVRGVSDVRTEADVSYIVVNMPPEERQSARHLHLYRELAEAGIPMRLVKLHPGGVSFAVEDQFLDRARQIINKVGYDHQAAQQMVILSVVAVNMREMYGVMARIAETLLKADVEIAQLGDSHDSVLCMVPKNRERAALKSLRTEFNLGVSTRSKGGAA